MRKEKKDDLLKEYYPEEFSAGTEQVDESTKIQSGTGRAGVLFRRGIALVLLFVFAAMFSVGSAGLVMVLSAGASVEEAVGGVDYYNLKNTEHYVHSQAYNLIEQDISHNSFWVDGTYDEEQTVDITNLSGGILVADKNPATTYQMKDLVTMYEKGVDGFVLDMINEVGDAAEVACPEVISSLEQQYGTSAYYVDNLGNLYAARYWSESDAATETGVEYLERDIYTYINKLPVIYAATWDPMTELGVVLYTVDDDGVNICLSMPEGFERIEEIGWTEFSARCVLDVSVLSERDQANFDYEAYGNTFLYLYQRGKELELFLPENGEYLALYAMIYPAEVSIYDLYKQFATAIRKVGSAVANGEYKNTDTETGQLADPLVYYWVQDVSNGKVWTNNGLWKVEDMSAVEREIYDHNEAMTGGLYYPFYVGASFVNETYTSDLYVEHDIAFSSNDQSISVNLVSDLLSEQFGIKKANYVLALNPLILDKTGGLEQDFYTHAQWKLYTAYSGYTKGFLLMMLAGGIGTAFCGIVSIVLAGRRDRTKVRYAGLFARCVPIELLLLLYVGCWVGYGLMIYAVFGMSMFGFGHGYYEEDYVLICLFLFGFIVLATWQILTLVIKGKSKNMRTHSLIGHAGNRVSKAAKGSAFTQKCPIEIMLLIFVAVWVVFCMAMAGLTDCVYSALGQMILIGVIFVCVALLLWWQITTLVHKAKTRNMLTNSLFKRFAGGIRQFYRNRKVTGKLFLLAAGLCALHLVIIGCSYASCAMGFGIFLLILLWIVMIAFGGMKCMQKQRIKDGIHEIAGGNMEYKIRMEKLTGDELDMAWDLNNIQEGMENAVERMMKSERMKTDLITNVSHDLKTPLTSIINYVDILKKENIQDPKIRGYIDILEQKSLRLKNLTEDLMEAAKISSGNITLELQNINLKQLLYQTNGEFEEKFAKRNLQLVCTLPESDVFICADGRRMWRVIENLYNNAAKYAQPYSRVYVDGKLQSGKVELIIKNVSEAPLNITADELMERFVRGDVARNTEGSGLGLEIARNLTVMQKGTFDIQLDGDLFKVILTFDAV